MKDYNTLQFEKDVKALKIALTNNQIQQFLDYYEMLIYHAGKMVVFINPSVYEHKYKVNSRIRIVYNCDSFDKVIVKDELTIKPLSIVIGENIA